METEEGRAMKYFNHISSNYDRVRGKEIFNSLLKTVKLFHIKDNDWILDVGTGTGLFSVLLAEHGFRIIGIDRNPQMLAKAISKDINNDCHFKGVLGSAEQLPFPSETFYLVISTNAIHHFDLYQHLKEVSRVLKTGGHYIIFSRFREQNVRSIWGQDFPMFADKETRLYNPDDFRLLKHYFPELELESIEELTFEIPFSADRLIYEAQQKKYSTFAFYTEDEFQQAFRKFRSNIVKRTDKLQILKTGRVIFRKKLDDNMAEKNSQLKALINIAHHQFQEN